MGAIVGNANISSSKETIKEVNILYEGKKWNKEINELFPFTKSGCFNFGYWDRVPEVISLDQREKSQLDLYHKLFNVAGIDRKSGSSILEVGCGRGHGVKLLSTLDHDSYGVDLVKAQIQRCVQNYPDLKSKFKEALCDKTGLKSDSFDFVISVEAAQHFPDFSSFVKEGHRVLKNGGKIAITTFFFTNEKSKVKLSGILPEGVLGMHRTISILKAEDSLKQAGFKNVEIMSIGSKVFDGFSKWAVQSMSEKNHTPRWVEAYDKKQLDYYVIVAEKV